MKTKKKLTQIGDTTWFVKYCSDIGPQQDGEFDPDLCKDTIIPCETKDDAEAKAKEVYPLSKTGTVSYWPATYLPYDESEAFVFPWAERCRIPKLL